MYKFLLTQPLYLFIVIYPIGISVSYVTNVSQMFYRLMWSLLFNILKNNISQLGMKNVLFVDDAVIFTEESANFHLLSENI